MYACFYPVGTPEGEEALERNISAGRNAMGLELPRHRQVLAEG
jgi:hypothetical protein